MPTLYDDQDDPLDGPIAAIEGIGRGVDAYNQGRRQNQAREDQRSDRAAQLHEIARRTALQERVQQFQMDQQQADSQGMLGTLDALYSPQGAGVQGPMPNGDTAQGAMSSVPLETRQAIRGMRGTGMSPQAIALMAREIGAHGKSLVDKRNKAHMLEDIGMWAAPDPNAEGGMGPKASQAPGADGDLWSGWMDPKVHAGLVQRLNDPNTTADEAERLIETHRGKRAEAIAAEEFKQNSLADMQEQFTSFVNDEIPLLEKMGMEIDPSKVFLARQLMHQIGGRRVRDPNQLAADTKDVMKTLYSAVVQPSSRSGKDKPSWMTPEDEQYDRDVKNAKDLGLTGDQALQYISESQKRRGAINSPATPSGSTPGPQAVAAEFDKLASEIKDKPDLGLNEIRGRLRAAAGKPTGEVKREPTDSEEPTMDNEYGDLLAELETDPPPARAIKIKQRMRELRGIHGPAVPPRPTNLHGSGM